MNVSIKNTYSSNFFSVSINVGKMSVPNDSNKPQIDIILPKSGILCQENLTDYILCKPKLMPLKSITLEKLEKMQKDAEEKLKEAQEAQEIQEVQEAQKAEEIRGLKEAQEYQEIDETVKETESTVLE